MVIHCTLSVPTLNSFINVGKVMFMAVSTITPQKDMMPVARTAPMTLAGMVVLIRLLPVSAVLFSVMSTLDFLRFVGS